MYMIVLSSIRVCIYNGSARSGRHSQQLLLAHPSYLQQPLLTKMHQIVICALAAVAVALAAPQQQEQYPVQILKQEADVNPEGYQFQFETSDGTSRQEQGTLKQITEDHKAIQVQGSYKYTAPDGIVYSVTYVADEHGFQPQEHVEHPGQSQQYQQ